MPNVYNPNDKPWIKVENASIEELKEQIEACPSGALTYDFRGSNNNDGQNEIEIKVLENGPLLVSGNLNIKYKDTKIELNNKYTLGVRPENILISNTDDFDIKVKVDYSEQLGSETYFYCSAEGMPQLVVHQSGQYKVSRGDKLNLCFNRESLHLFGSDKKAIVNKIF